jgi:hypothetical protein
MSIVLVGSTSGSITLQEPAVAGTTVLDLPATSGTVLVGGTQNIPKSALPTGSVLQVVSTTKTDTFSTSSTSYTDLTGLSVSITPTSATSKVLVFYTVNGKQTTTPSMRLVRNSTAICIADSWGGNQGTAGTFQGGSDNNQTTQIAGNFLDSPATTSATTYKIQVITDGGAAVYYNRSPNDYYARYTSTITVMEIAA